MSIAQGIAVSMEIAMETQENVNVIILIMVAIVLPSFITVHVNTALAINSMVPPPSPYYIYYY